MKYLLDTCVLVDSPIAAIALARNMTLVTRNEKDFEGFGVRVFNPFESANGSGAIIDTSGL